MKLGLAQLKEGENAFQFTSPQDAWLVELAKRVKALGTRLLDPIKVEIKLTKLEPDYYLKGSLDFSAEQVCGRCAETFAMTVHHPFELGMAHVKSATPGEAALSEESEELDVTYFQGTELDLGPVIEEQVFLSLPYAPICRPDCKGICQKCGSDLNVGACLCAATKPPNAFAALGQLKL
jgi:uncharacterized protein